MGVDHYLRPNLAWGQHFSKRDHAAALQQQPCRSQGLKEHRRQVVTAHFKDVTNVGQVIVDVNFWRDAE
jgi:hypothetical protein